MATNISNLGPGLGDIASNWPGMEPVVKWRCAGLMVLGRLKVFANLVLVTRTFWRP